MIEKFSSRRENSSTVNPISKVYIKTLIFQMFIADYYRILEINRKATATEIKKAFRKLAKRYHPDKNPGREEFAERMFRQICTAYETLCYSQQRLKYDITLDAAVEEHQPQAAYLKNLRKATQKRQKYELMFQELLNRNDEAGIRIYEELQREDKKVQIDDFLNYADSRDCEFLIAEAYYTLGNYRTAMRIYESLVSHEKRRMFFHHFTDEIKARLKQVYLYFLTHPQRLEDIPADLERVCDLNLPKRETAWIYKKLAEFYFDINRHIQAERMLNTAFELHPRLTGAKRICQKLGVEYLLSQRVKQS